MLGELGQQADPQWNLHKLLVGKDGKAIRALGPQTDPLSPEIVQAVEVAPATTAYDFEFTAIDGFAAAL